MTTVEDLHRLVGQLSESELDPARRYLEYLRDSTDPLVQKLLTAPLDDEDVTDEGEAAIAESEEDFAAGRTVSHEDLKAELGL